ncbi:hypothetical protein DSM106972_016060 [Dulcicalothrix desertica PCC 7102]|uniref:Uncharacterized protein n=1 Tax=Dulcicalothrix desertica PCC 7102 TaxID=232991 RepID=A0A3S1CTN3_9CYAN|nr:hypothetical protein [Dulcicalothrix desertica]RUT08438.1 hypothetical protein DSM106972_016060 [Dulcicalothrix desertica PCC 7102]TWH40303.1 hypothetical protein CAL7102_09610 [Dulcicalothrix desertica PCC 7102]
MEITGLLIVLSIISLSLQLIRLLAPSLEKLYQFQPRKRKRRYGDDVYQLEDKLLTLLRGDGAAAKRLLRLSRQRYPGRNAKWHVEKVIWDLERDRY